MKELHLVHTIRVGREPNMGVFKEGPYSWERAQSGRVLGDAAAVFFTNYFCRIVQILPSPIVAKSTPHPQNLCK